MSRPKRLSLGCGGKIVKKGFIGVDLYSPNADIIADLRTWDDVETNSVIEIEAIHFIEHLSLEQGQDLCQRIHRWLKPGGTLVVEMPCRDKCLSLLDEYKAQHKFEGCKGLIGGTSGDKKALNAWIWRNIDIAVELVLQGGFPIPVDRSLHCDGELHQYVWGTHEFCSMLRDIGFRTETGEPIYHGKRAARDMRVVATK